MQPVFSKVKAGTAAGGLAVVIATFLVSILASFGVDIPLEILVGVVGAVIVIAQFVASFFKKELVGYKGGL